MNATLRLLLVLTVLAFTATHASAIPGRAEVMKVVGTATATDAKGAPKSITQGMVLGTGDTITTGAASTVDLNLGLNGDFLRVDPDTTLALDQLDIGNVAERTVTTQLNVKSGQILGNVVNKLTKASKYEIKSAAGVAGIRGTKYSIFVPKDATQSARLTRIIVTEGTVTFGNVTISAANGPVIYAMNPDTGAVVVQPLVGAIIYGQIGERIALSASLARIYVDRIDRTVGTSTSVNNVGTTTLINNPADVSTSVK